MPTELEDQFIRAYFRDHSGGRLANSIAASNLLDVSPEPMENAGLIAYAYPDFWRVTPRGMDLIATADAIGYDPDASKSAHCECLPNAADDPAAEDWRMYTAEGCATCGKPAPPLATRECPDCNGRGRVPISELRGRTRTISELLHDEPAEAFVLPGWDVTCARCNGAKVVPDTAKYSTKACETGRTSSAAKPQPVEQFAAAPGEWIDFTCLTDVEGWEGATIEVRHRDGEHHSSCTLQSIHAIADNYYRVCTSSRPYSSHAGWQFRKLASEALPLPGGSIGYTATSAPSAFSFHAAWAEAKARPDYHKPDWNRAQRHHEHECYELSTWLKIVRDAPGRVDIRDASRPAALAPPGEDGQAPKCSPASARKYEGAYYEVVMHVDGTAEYVERWA